MNLSKQADEQQEFILDHLYDIDYSGLDSSTINVLELKREELKIMLKTYRSIIEQSKEIGHLIGRRRLQEDVNRLASSLSSMQKEKDRIKSEGIEVIDLYDVDDGDLLRLIERRFGHGAASICKERARQIDKEGYDSSHDDQHTQDEIAIAAAIYAMPEDARPPMESSGTFPHGSPKGWPWDDLDWKPTPQNRTKELTKSGALVAAEIDRLGRGVTTQNDSE